MAGDPCASCVPPAGYVTRADTDRFPSTWRPLPDAPRWVVSSRQGGVVRCTACGRDWYLFHDPKEMFFTDVVELPRHARALLGEASLGRIWPAIDDGSRFVHLLLLPWLSNARYDLGEAVRGLVRRAGDRRASPADAERMLVYLRHVLGGASARGAWQSARARGAPVIELASVAGLVRLRERVGRAGAGGSPRLRAELESVLEGMFGTAFGRAADLVGAPPHERRQLLGAAAAPAAPVAAPPPPPAPAASPPRAAASPADAPAAGPPPRFALGASVAAFALAYPYLMPGAALNLFFVEMVARNAWPQGDPLLSIPFFALGGWLLPAGAARAQGFLPGGLIGSSWYRAADFTLAWIGCWLLGLGYALAAALVMIALTGYRPEAGPEALHPTAGEGPVLWAFGVGAVWLGLRLWPAYVTRFLYRGERVSSTRGPFWHGPGLVTAYRMTGRPGALSRASLPVALSALPCLASLWLAGRAGGATLVPGVLLLHFVALPWLTHVAVERAAHLRLPGLAWAESGPPL